MKVRWTRWLLWPLASLFGIYLFLLIPDRDVVVPHDENRRPFAWNRDEYWSALESRFKAARLRDCTSLSPEISQRLSYADSLSLSLRTAVLSPADSSFEGIESNLFELAVLVAVCPARINEYIESYGRLRQAVKNQSAHWDVDAPLSRERIYRLLYGGRIAIEEAMLQSSERQPSMAIVESNEPSVTPATDILGVEIHSGDILVSRGGAPTSALIARGSDYPGNFSHIALVYVDERTGVTSIIESHIERGVTLTSIADYLKDTKLRLLVLRLRSDLPELRADPMLPHWAAKFMYERAKSRHIAYDFAMNTKDASTMFCAEVAGHAYDHVGLGLWAGSSHLSGTGVRNWLAAFGVRYFITQEPSDLEYDPQICVVAEWRDYETLYKDHLDNAVVDIMIESADSGAVLRYDWRMLPVARVLKAYSAIINRFGGVGPVPEGMTATAAAKNKWFSKRHHDTVERLRILAGEFHQQNGYAPPYWELVKLARRAYAATITQ